MKKKLFFLCFFVFFVGSTFAYTPNSRDNIFIIKITQTIEKFIKNKGEIVRNPLITAISNIKNKNNYKKDERIQFILKVVIDNIQRKKDIPLIKGGNFIIKNKNNSCENNYSVFDVIINNKKVSEIKLNYCRNLFEYNILFQDNDSIYFTIEQIGLGGFILYSTYDNLYKLNKYDNSIKLLWNGSSDLGISNDGKFIVYQVGEDMGLAKNIVIKNLKTNVETILELPPKKKLGPFQIGGFKFSPDYSKIAMGVGYSPMNDEIGDIFIYNIKTKKYNLYEEKKYKIKRWIDNQNLETE